ncbi:MAG: hypothetical protein IJ864_00815 [Alphaproteobacteria bacterium]|nr:hypothetical protein [Alphaproteobacteria bacterium]
MMINNRYMMRLAFSSEFYFIKAMDLKNLPVRQLPKHSSFDEKTVVLFLSADGSVSLAEGVDLVKQADNYIFLKTVVAYYSYVPLISFFLTLIKPIKRRFYIRSSVSFTIHLADMIKAGLPRGERNAQNAYQLNNKRWHLDFDEAQKRYQKLRVSLQKKGYDKNYPMYVMLNRKFGAKDQLLQGHHRIGLCKELGISEVAISFWAAPATFTWLQRCLRTNKG